MTFIVLGLVGALALFFVSVYNRLIKGRNAVKNAFAQIDVQLTRRYDLIPNLVETAKAYLAHEKETLTAVIQARNQAVSAASAVKADPSRSTPMKNLIGAEGELSAAMGKLMLVMEAYPDLKANTTVNGLMEELTSTENKVSFARQAFNDAVMFYNNTREAFPNSIVADQMKFEEAQPYTVEDPKVRQAIKVKF